MNHSETFSASSLEAGGQLARVISNMVYMDLQAGVILPKRSEPLWAHRCRFIPSSTCRTFKPVSEHTDFREYFKTDRTIESILKSLVKIHSISRVSVL